MTRIFATRAKAVEITTTLSGYWTSGAHYYSDQSGQDGAWDSQKYDILAGVFYHTGQPILSGQLEIQQAVASGYFDLSTSFSHPISTAFEFEVPLRGKYVRVHLRHSAATSNQNVSGPTAIRMGTWGKVADNVVEAKARVYHQASGQWINQAASLSGTIEVDVVNAVPNTIRPATTLPLTSNSGGIILTSAAVQGVVIKSIVTNSGDVYIGGAIAGVRPYSNYGYLLSVGETVSMEIDQVGRLAAFAQVSGDKISYMGVDRA